jgi:hypothetical protein
MTLQKKHWFSRELVIFSGCPKLGEDAMTGLNSQANKESAN